MKKGLRIPLSIRYIFSVFVTGILFFTFFRCVLFFTNRPLLDGIPNLTGNLLYSFLMGLRFDTVISGYLLILPLFILIVADNFKILSRRLLFWVQAFICVVYSIAFFACAADIPFFKNYNTRLNVTILNWTDSPVFMMKMVWQDNIFLTYFFVFIVVSVLFILLLRRIYRRYGAIMAEKAYNVRLGFKITASVFALGLMMLGIRGRTDEKAPIMVGTAYFSQYDMLNQAGLNPVYTLMQSWMDGMKDENKQLHLMDDAKAIQLAQQYLHINPSEANKDFPVYRKIISDEPEHKYNVVLITMESMSAYYMARYGNKDNLTPNLDSLADRGYAFDNFYSAGMHTFNGIFATLYSYPALMAKHNLEVVPIPKYTGLPYFMKQRNYKTIYFITHDDQFDNIGGFLTANNIERVISKKDYPSDQVKSTLGVPDHNMFDYSIPVLNEYYKAGKPFFAGYMTTSNHGPYVIPQGIPFTPKHTDVRGGCVEYADWAIGHYMQEAAKQPWFGNTIFVFVADHGATEGTTYGDMPLTYNHIPCIIYCPSLNIMHRAIKNPGGQIDIFPTIAGLLGGNYDNNTLGMDLLHESRPWMYFSQDDKVGVADSSLLYEWHQRGGENIYTIRDRKEHPELIKQPGDSMKQYALSMIQSAQWLLNNHKTGAVK